MTRNHHVNLASRPTESGQLSLYLCCSVCFHRLKWKDLCKVDKVLTLFHGPLISNP